MNSIGSILADVPVSAAPSLTSTLDRIQANNGDLRTRLDNFEEMVARIAGSIPASTAEREHQDSPPNALTEQLDHAVGFYFEQVLRFEQLLNRLGNAL